jgi:fibronectin type 3 domain-containing protein
VRPVVAEFSVAGPADDTPVADGETLDVFRVSGATPGALYTLSTTLGTVAGVTDADPRYAGLQIVATDSDFSFQVQRGSIAGSAQVGVEEVTGASRGAAVQEYRANPVRRFDFNNGASPTATGFTGLGSSNAYSAALGYGWQTTASTFSRSGPSDLLRDGHWGTNNTFLADVAGTADAPVTYVVNVTVGDASFARNHVAVRAENAATPQLSGLATAAGQFLHRSFEVEVADGQLSLQIYSAGGDPYFTINALEIRAKDTVADHRLTSDDDLDYRGTATPGAWVTLQASAGSIATADENSEYAGVQVRADGTTGEFSFTLVPPVCGGEVTVTSEEVTGQGRGASHTDTFDGAATWQFDFNAAGSPNFGTYTNVGATNVYDAEQGYGWTSNASTFSRGIANALLRDGHWGTNNTFNVDVPDGDYFVNVTFGDASFARNQLAVRAENAATPQLSDLATAAGQFLHRSFEVEVADGQLNLQIYSAGGDPYFTINALEIWRLNVPDSVVKSHTLSVSDSRNPDGSYTVSGSGANPDAVITVNATLGSVQPVSPATDADTLRAGVQVQADENGSFRFNINPPAGGGSVTLRSLEVDGRGRGEREEGYAVPTVRRFDFNGSGNALQDGFTGVRGNNLYNANNGYGWTTTVSEFQRGETGYSVSPANVPLYRDGHWGSAARTFQVAVDPDATYDVRVYVGDRSFARNMIRVTVEGAPATFDENPNSPRVIPSTTANGFVAVTIVGGQAADGVLDITIVNTGGDPYWVINGIDVWKRDPDNPSLHEPGVANLLAATWSSEMVGHRLTEAAVDAVLPLAREYWVSTGLADWQMAQLYQTPIAIGDLSYRGALGVARPEGIWLDASGAGLGWNVGSSQWSVGSGQWLGDISHQRTTANGQLPTAAYDLLTVVTHELGHVLGYGDLDGKEDHVMAGVLHPGVSRVEFPAGRGLDWLADAESPRLALERADGGRFAAGGRGLLVDRVLDDLLRDDLRVSKDAWSREENDELERLLTGPRGEGSDEIDDFFAQL